MWAAGNGGEKGDSCAADGYTSSIYTIGIGSAASDGTQASYDEPCSGKLAVVFVDNPHPNGNDVVRFKQCNRLLPLSKCCCAKPVQYISYMHSVPPSLPPSLPRSLSTYLHC